VKSSYALQTKKTSEPGRRVGRCGGCRRSWLLGALVGVALSIQGNGAPAAELIDSVQARYQDVRDLQADFEQRARIASIDKTESSAGKVTILRPGRMRWEYTAPEARVIALDGQSIRMYLPEDEQLQIAPLDAGSFPPTALDFLLGSGDLRTSFDGEELAPNERQELGLRLRPKADASFEFLEIWVSPQDYELRESIVVDLFGNRTAVRFSTLRENQGIDASAFEVRVPEGTDVIDLREGN